MKWFSKVLQSVFAVASLTMPPVQAQASQPDEPPAVVRPQTPTPPFPYRSLDISFPGGDAQVLLAGTLTLPLTDTPLPAVVLLAGSGRTDRDETYLGHKSMLVLSDMLTRAGFAVLRYDKRGVDQSTGDFRAATPLDFKADAHAAVNYLKTRAEIDDERIAVVGHSEGGSVAVLMAADRDPPAAVVSLAGMIAPFGDQILLQELVTGRDMGADAAYEAALEQSYRAVFAALSIDDDSARVQAMRRISADWLESFSAGTNAKAAEESLLAHPGLIGSQWFRSFVKLSVTDALASSTIPVLLLNGGSDQQVVEGPNLAAARQALGRETSLRRTRAFPGLNHLFQESASGSTDDYGTIEQTLSPQVLRAVVGFLTEAM